MLAVEAWENSCKFSSLPVDRNYQKGQSGIHLLSNSKYKRRRINVTFLQDNKNINVHKAQNWGKTL
jgi:hypothetical protein